MNTQIAAYSATEAALIDLATKYKGVIYDVTTPSGMADAKAAYKDINAEDAGCSQSEEEMNKKVVARLQGEGTANRGLI